MAIAGANGYRNGTPETGSISSVAYDSTNDIYIGGWNANGTYSAVFVGSIQAIAFYSSVLTAQNIADLTTAMNAL